MYICALANQKGGVGKTTTTQNLGTMLALAGKRVLLIDLDAQGNLTDAFGLHPQELERTMFQVMDGSLSLGDICQRIESNLYLAPANINLAAAELALAGRMGRENLLKKALGTQWVKEQRLDYVLIDCPPSLGLLTINALAAASGILIPVQAEYYALAGLALIQQTLTAVRENLNPHISILGVVLTFYDQRKKLNRDVASCLKDEWGDLLFRAVIRDNVSLAEAPSNGQHIMAYKAASYGAQDYVALAGEFTRRTGGKA